MFPIYNHLRLTHHFFYLVLSLSLLQTLVSLSTNTIAQSLKLITISEKVWRKAAANHRKRIRSILQPGLTSRHDQINSGSRSRRQRTAQFKDDWTALDPINPIYNFLTDYYGIKGSKGTRRLGRWSPDPSLSLSNYDSNIQNRDIDIITDIQIDVCGDVNIDDIIYKAAMKASGGKGGIFLQNANEEDMGGTLHLRGSIPVLSQTDDDGDDNNQSAQKFYGILYNPALFYNRYESIKSSTERQEILKLIAPFQWYSSILRSTLASEPIFHCFGLHEWAMQYHPLGAPPPPSAKYQLSLPLRVSREVINKTVERKGISCTHVDALRFFAPAAGPLNHHGAELERTEQLNLEQKACVHAHMDLLKIALKLQPFLQGELLGDVLEVAIKSRILDVEASPYDAREYGVGVVAVETQEGRKAYKDRQSALMKEVEPVRIRLMKAYDDFMELAFEEEFLCIDSDTISSVDLVNKDRALTYIAPERFAKAQPGGLPWRRNLIKV